MSTNHPRRTEVTYRLTDATPADESWLDGLRRRAYADLFEATWGDWDEDRHLRQFSASLGRGHISIIEVGGTRVGMIQLVDDGDTVEIAEIQIDPSHQSRGIGTCVLRDVVSDATARGRGIRLRVGLKNEKALALYDRLGFKPVEQSKTHCEMRYKPES